MAWPWRGQPRNRICVVGGAQRLRAGRASGRAWAPVWVPRRWALHSCGWDFVAAAARRRPVVSKGGYSVSSLWSYPELSLGSQRCSRDPDGWGMGYGWGYGLAEVESLRHIRPGIGAHSPVVLNKSTGLRFNGFWYSLPHCPTSFLCARLLGTGDARHRELTGSGGVVLMQEDIRFAVWF